MIGFITSYQGIMALWIALIVVTTISLVVWHENKKLARSILRLEVETRWAEGITTRLDRVVGMMLESAERHEASTEAHTPEAVAASQQ